MGANYAVYIEDYVLSYLKREVDSLELSEIFFYGKRENGGRKFLVYGAGRQKEIAAFAEYELLEELVCRLTQAGPVFMVREKNGDYKTCGFQTFYANNEAMQNYLIEWTSRLEKDAKDVKADFNFRRADLTELREAATARASFETEDKRKSGSAISAQLGLILVVLVAIVISSANSYDKMERMNQSAREVFFAIENQEAGQESGQSDVTDDSLAGDVEQQEKATEILVERDTRTDEVTVEDAVRAENAAQTATASDQEERVDQSGAGVTADDAGSGGQTENDNRSGKDTTIDSAEGKEDSAVDAGSKQEETAAGNEEADKEDSSEEALSRNITRYYEVERGDTLYTISQKIYGDASRVDKICELNKISNPDRISEGQKIILP